MEPEFKPETIAPEPKQKLNYKRLLLMALVVAVVAGATVLATWYFMNKQVDDNKTANSAQVSSLQKQIDNLKKANATDVISKTALTQTTTLTNDQIFQEVSTQLGLKKSSIGYFKIYGQDKVGYSYYNGAVSQFSGYAYKQSGKWNSVVVGQGVQGCTMYSSVPEQYKPVCMIENNNVVTADAHTAYLNSGEDSINYPTASAVKYIGS